jgi:hypothetical protein
MEGCPVMQGIDGYVFAAHLMSSISSAVKILPAYVMIVSFIDDYSYLSNTIITYGQKLIQLLFEKKFIFGVSLSPIYCSS